MAGWIDTLPLSEIRTDVHSLSPHSVRGIGNETGRGGRHDSTIGTVDDGSHQRQTGPELKGGYLYSSTPTHRYYSNMYIVQSTQSIIPHTTTLT